MWDPINFLVGSYYLSIIVNILGENIEIKFNKMHLMSIVFAHDTKY